jgi:hypothetical protein
MQGSLSIRFTRAGRKQVLVDDHMLVEVMEPAEMLARARWFCHNAREPGGSRRV